MVLVEDVSRVIFPSELGSENVYHGAPVREPRFIGFRCFGCGERHADLAGLLDCQERLRIFYARQVHALPEQVAETSATA